MLDLKDECSVCEDRMSNSSSNPSTTTTTSPRGSSNSNSNNNGNSNEGLKRCTDCQTTTTPLWRGGPAGPKTLCNACGIKYHKKRRANLGLDKGKVEKSKKKNKNNINGGNVVQMRSLKIKMASGGGRQREIFEVEQAARLLMALSYG